MTCQTAASLTRRLVLWPTGAGASRAARRAMAGWSKDPVLSVFPTPGEAALSVRTEGPEATVVLGALVARRGDEWAATAALSGVADRLAPIVGRWSRWGLSDQSLTAAEADLLAAVVEVFATRRPTPAPALVVQFAWQAVYGARRTEKARAARRAPLPPDLSGPAARPTSALPLLADATARKVVTRSHAQALAAHVAGCSTAAVARWAGVTPAAVRARRKRGLQTLTRTNQVVGW